jgi:hypothetical protein
LRLGSALLALALALAPGCAGTGDYLHDRALDAVDMLRVHVIVGNALGAEVQVTQWIGLGFMHEDKAWAGGLANRKFTTWDETISAWGLLIHNWNERTKGLPYYSGSYGWWQRDNQPDAKFYHRDGATELWTVRASIAVLIGADAEVRVGEIFDFIVGIVGWDPAHDDQ